MILLQIVFTYYYFITLYIYDIYIYIYIYIYIFIYIYIYIYIYIVIVIFIWLSPFIPSRNLDEVFTYNHMALMSLRSRSRVKASMVLKRADNLCIHNYIRSLLNIIVRPILIVLTGLEPVSYRNQYTDCVSDALAN